MASAFEFVQGNERLDWGILVSIDVHRLMKDTNVDTLQRVVENIAFSRITRDEAAMFTPDHILQLFQLSQLVIQYLVYSQECLAKMNLKLNERLEDLQNAQRDAQDTHAALTEENAALKKEVKAQRRTLLAYEYNAAAGVRPAAASAAAGPLVCPLCGETYHKQESLQSHMRKRHYGATMPAPPPPPLAASSTGAATGTGAGANVDHELQRVQARVQQLEAKLERDRDAMDRQRDQMMLLLFAKNGNQGAANVAYTPPPPSSQPPQSPQPPTGTSLVGVGAPAFDSPHRAGASVGDSLLPSAVSAIPVVPDTAALMEYNYSRQREATDNALARQLRDLEKEIRDLRSGNAAGTSGGSGVNAGAEAASTAAATHGVSTATAADGSSPVPSAPSWLSSLGLPSVPTSTPIPLPSPGTASTGPLTPPVVSGVSEQAPDGTPPPLPFSASAPATSTPNAAQSEAQRQQELANYLKYGPTGPAFVPPPPSSVVPNPNTPLPLPAGGLPSAALPVPVPQLSTPKERTRTGAHRQSRASSTHSYSYSYSSSSSRTASPPAPTVRVPTLPLAAVPQIAVPPPPMTAYEAQQHQQKNSSLPSTPKRKKDKRDKRDKKGKHDKKHKSKSKDEPQATASGGPVPMPELARPLSVPSVSASANTSTGTTSPSATPSYAAMLQQYQDQLLRPTASPAPLPDHTRGNTPLQLNTVGSPPQTVPTATTSVLSLSGPVPPAAPGVGHNYGVAPPPPAVPHASVPAWLRTHESRSSSSGSSSSTSTVPPNRISGTGPAPQATSTATSVAPPSAPPPSIQTAAVIPVLSAYQSQSVTPAPQSYYGTQNTGALGVPSAGTAPLPTSTVVPSPYATASYMTGSSGPTPTPIPVPKTASAAANTVAPIPVPIPSPYYSTSTPLSNSALPQPGVSSAGEVKAFRPRISSSDSSSSRYSY